MARPVPGRGDDDSPSGHAIPSLTPSLAADGLHEKQWRLLDREVLGDRGLEHTGTSSAQAVAIVVNHGALLTMRVGKRVSRADTASSGAQGRKRGGDCYGSRTQSGLDNG
jgi:hypothetical protein